MQKANEVHPISAEESTLNLIDDYVGVHGKGKTPEEKKFIACYMARRVLSEIGNMQERLMSLRLLKRMKSSGKKK